MPELTTGCDVDPARLLPQLLDQLIALGQIAQQLRYALTGNDHRAKTTRLNRTITRRKEPVPNQPRRLSYHEDVLA